MIGKKEKKSQLFSLEIFSFFNVRERKENGNCLQTRQETDPVTIYKTESQPVVEVLGSRFGLNLKSDFLIIGAIPQWNGLFFKMMNPLSCKCAKRTMTSFLSFKFSSVLTPIILLSFSLTQSSIHYRNL